MRTRHIPGFRAIDGVELVSVSNRGRESSERAAAEFGLPKVYDNWLDLVRADDTDAICIGTWPSMHCPVTLAALRHDKHVLTEARMAMNAAEARAMLDASRAAPHLVTQIAPPFTFKAAVRLTPTLREMLAAGYLGDLLTVEMLITQRKFVDTESPMNPRLDRDLSGYNTMLMGIWYEILMHWIGPASRVMAMTRTVVPQRRDAQGVLRTVSVPDHVDVLCQMVCGAQAHLRFSAVTGLAPANDVWLFGSRGTLKVDVEKAELYGGTRDDKELAAVAIPPDKESRWRVEEEFVNAIRGIEPVKFTTFADGVRYMEFTEAVARSAQAGKAIALPL
jgi:predicted dehydrogenase